MLSGMLQQEGKCHQIGEGKGLQARGLSLWACGESRLWWGSSDTSQLCPEGFLPWTSMCGRLWQRWKLCFHEHSSDIRRVSPFIFQQVFGSFSSFCKLLHLLSLSGFENPWRVISPPNFTVKLLNAFYTTLLHVLLTLLTADEKKIIKSPFGFPKYRNSGILNTYMAKF